MDKELENILREAHSLGAQEADLDQIVAAYGAKKKRTSVNDLNGGSPQSGIGSNPFQATQQPKAPQIYTPARQKEYIANNTYTPPKSKPKSLKEAVDDDDSYIGAIWNQIPNAVADAIGGLSKFAGKGLIANPYVQALESGFEIAKQATGSEADNPIDKIATVQNAERVGKFAEQAALGMRTSSSSKENEERIQQGFDVTDGISKKDIAAVPVMLTRLAADIGLAAPTSGITFAAQGYNQGLKEYDEAIKDNPEIGNDNVRELFGMLYGGINGLADKISLGVLTKNKATSKAVKSFILKSAINSLKETKGKITSEAIERVIQKATKETVNKLKISGVKFLKAGAAEGGTEAIQGGASDGLKILANKVQDADVFNIQEVAENFWTTRINDAAGGALLGGVLGAGLAGAKSSDKYVAERVAESTTPEEIESVKQELTGMVESGELTQDRAEALAKSVDTYSAANQKLPAGLSTTQRVKALQLVRDRDVVKKQKEEAVKTAENVDDAIKPEVENEVAILENKEQQYNDGIREIATESKYKYFKDPEKDKWYKQLGEGKPEEITQEYYELQKQDNYIPKEPNSLELDTQQVISDELNPQRNKQEEEQIISQEQAAPSTDIPVSIDQSGILERAERDLISLKQVDNKPKKYDASIKRLSESKNMGLISEADFESIKSRFDDIIQEYKPKAQKREEEVNIDDAGIVDAELELDQDLEAEVIELPSEKRTYHTMEKDKAVDDIKSRWQKLSVLQLTPDPITQNEEVAKLFDALTRYVYHSFMDGSIALKGKISDKIDEIVKKFGLVDIDDEQYEKIEDIIKTQAGRAKTELKSFKKSVKEVIRESTQVASDFKQKDLISRLSQMKRRLADEVRGFKKGVKEGVADSKERQIAKDDIIAGLREEMKLQIREAKESGAIKGAIKSTTFVNTINRINNAKTPLQLLKAIDYVSKMLADVDYDHKLATANQLRGEVKKLAKRKGLPSNIVEALRNITRFSPSDLDDINQLNVLLNSVVDNIKGANVTGINTGLLNDVPEYLSQEKQRNTRERYELLLGGEDGGYQQMTLEEMKVEIDELTSDGYKQTDSRRDADEAVSELLREDLSVAELDDYTHPQEIEAIKALRQVNLSELTDRDLRLYNIAVNNLLLNGKLNGTGLIVSIAKKQARFSNKALLREIEGTTRAVSALADSVRKNWATIPTQLKSFINNDRTLAKYYVITGLADIKNGYTRVANRVGEVEKAVENIIRGNPKLRDNPKRQLEVAVFADLNQYEQGASQEDIIRQFEGRKAALLETIERLKLKSSRDVKFRKAHSGYIQLVEEIYGDIKDLRSIADMKLDDDQRELYNYMLNYYLSTQEDTRLNAEIYNNINFKPIHNYFPRTYNRIDDLFGANAEKQMESKLISESVFYNKEDIKGEESGAKNARTIKEDQLPVDKVINLDLVSNFLNTARNILYDVETQPARQYAASVLTSDDMRQLTKDDSSIEITQRITKQLVRNQRLGILPQHSKSVGRALSEFYRGTANRFALGGATQAIKQGASAFVTTIGVLGENSGLLAHSIHELIINNDAANQLMAGMSISRRGIEKSALTHVNIKESDVAKLNKSMEKAFVRLIDNWNDFADYVSLSSLIWGDLNSAKASWLAFYKDYLIREGVIKSLQDFNLEAEVNNRNAEAAEYAEQMVNTTLNSNDRTMQPEMKLGGIFPFTSFSINAKINLAIDLARATRKGIPKEERIRALRMVAGHVASSVVLNKIAWAVRMYMIYEAVELVEGYIEDDPEEEKMDELIVYLKSLQDEMFARNDNNTTEYIIKDIVFGGILSQFTDPIYSSIKELVTGEQQYSRPSDILAMAGIYGIPANAIIQLGEKAYNLVLPDEQFVTERFGIEAADGSKLYIPKESADEKRPDWARKSMAASAAINALQVLSSASSQELGSISRRLPGLVKKLEDKKYGAKRKFNAETTEKSFSEITRAGKTYTLNAEQVAYRKKKREEWLKDWYFTVKSFGTDKESEQIARRKANTYSAEEVFFKFDNLKEKE